MSKELNQIASDFAGNRRLGAGHGWPSWEAKLLEKGFISGAKSKWVKIQKHNTAIKFANWMSENEFRQYADKKWYSDFVKYSGCSYTTEELFQEFLKTKQ